MTFDLKSAIVDTLNEAINLSADKIVRVDIKSNWPVAAALTEVIKTFPNCIVGLLDLARARDLKDSGVIYNDDPHELTQLRNLSRNSSTDPLVLVGSASGKSQAGLKQLRTVVTQLHVTKKWNSNIKTVLENRFQEKELQIRKNICETLLQFVNEKKLTGTSVDSYFSNIFDERQAESKFLDENLWLLGLLPDENLLSSSNVSSRLEFNAEKIEELELDFHNQGSKFRKLSVSTNPKVVSFVSWLANHDDLDLKKSDLSEVLKALKESETTPPPISKFDDFLKVLGNKSFKERPEILSLINQEIDGLEIETLDEIMIELNAPVPTKLLIQGSFQPMQLWRSLEAELASSGEKVESSTPISIVELKNEEQKSFANPYGESFYRNAIGHAIPSAVVEEFFIARKDIFRISQHFALDSTHALSFLVASPKSLQISIRYIESWKSLLKSFLNSEEFEGKDNLGVILGVIDGYWTRECDAFEKITEPKIGMKNMFEAVAFLPFHPWRLEPLVQLAIDVIERYELDPNVIDTALWALERSIPSFRVLQIAGGNLNYSTIIDGQLQFDAQLSNALTPISVFSSLLKRTFNAYRETHPWSLAGTTISIINAPAGGFTKKLSSELKASFGHEPALLLVKDRGTKGTERDIDLPGIVITQDVENISAWLKSTEISKDITLFFIAGMNGQSTELGIGAHGSVDIILTNSGFDASGKPKNVPQIRLAPDEENETVTLLRKVGGCKEVRAETYDLTLPDNVQKIIPLAANNSAWLIVAAPSAISNFSVSDTHGNKFFQIAEFDEGVYRFFVFARSIETLSETVRVKIKELPIAASRKTELESLINGLTHTLPQKVFDIALNRFGPEEALGLINARALAHQRIKQGDLVVEISLDNVSWTQQWFDRASMRADLILAIISSDPKSEVGVKIVVVEAKGTTKSFVDPSLTAEPLREAVEQVETTRDLLNSLFLSRGNGIIETLQVRTLVEQIAAKAAAKYVSSNDSEKDKLYNVYFSHISTLGNRNSQFNPPIEGMAIATFLEGVQRTKELRAENDLTIISASSRLLEQVLKDEKIEDSEYILKAANTNVRNDISEVLGRKPSEPMLLGASDLIDKVSSVKQSQDSSSQPSNLDVSKVVGELSKFLAYRSEFVGSVAEAQALIGPTFISVKFPFDRGAVLAPLQRAESDIARDLGVKFVNIENDEQAGRIQVLIPRLDRQFPQLIYSNDEINIGGHYLNLSIGQDLSGTDFQAPISTWPHALVAGTTGSGKTSFIRSILGQLNNWGSKYSEIALVDGKGETDYIGSLTDSMYVSNFPEPLLNISEALTVLEWLKDEEVPRRKELVRNIAKESGVRADAKSLFIEALNSQKVPVMKPLIVVIDEFNELMIRGGQDKTRFVDAITSIAQASRSVLVHLILATQRPDRNVVPGVIKANLPARFAFRLPSPADSLTVLNHGGAEKLLGFGDLLLQLNGETDRRLQSYWLD